MVENKILSVPSTARPAYGGTVNRPPLNPRAYGKSSEAASWLSPTGVAKSLATNVRDIPHTINVNGLRSKRPGCYTEQIPEGGKSYSARVNTDNFVEERWDRNFCSETVPSLVRCRKMYQSEATERQNDALPKYREAVAAQGLAARVSETPHDHRSAHKPRTSANHLSYASDGFVRGANVSRGDATIDRKQGSAWVGTAPCESFRTVQSTMLDGRRAEFQKIHPSAGGKEKVVTTCAPAGLPLPSASLDRTFASYAAGERHASHWQSMYSTEISKHRRL